MHWMPAEVSLFTLHLLLPRVTSPSREIKYFIKMMGTFSFLPLILSSTKLFTTHVFESKLCFKPWITTGLKELIERFSYDLEMKNVDKTTQQANGNKAI